MTKLLVLVLTLFCFVATTPALAVGERDLGTLLSEAEMGALLGGGCSQQVGVMVTGAFVSGLAWAPVPLLGQIALAGAIVFGVGVALTC